MKQEQITKILEDINPAISSIDDKNIKAIFITLIAIIHEQQKTIEAQRKEIQELKEKLNANSNNSSKPPSTDMFKPNKNTKGNKKRKRGGQNGHPGVTRQLLPENEVNHIEKHAPQDNCSCGGQIKASKNYKRHQVHEIPLMQTIVTEHQLFYGSCKECGKRHSAQLPKNIPTGMLGPGLLALIATLTSDYKMSKRDVTRILEDLYNLPISIATVKRAEETVREALTTSVNEAKKYVKAQKVVNCDETSHAECGKKMWT